MLHALEPPDVVDAREQEITGTSRGSSLPAWGSVPTKAVQDQECWRSSSAPSLGPRSQRTQSAECVRRVPDPARLKRIPIIAIKALGCLTHSSE